VILQCSISAVDGLSNTVVEFHYEVPVLFITEHHAMKA